MSIFNIFKKKPRIEKPKAEKLKIEKKVVQPKIKKEKPAVKKEVKKAKPEVLKKKKAKKKEAKEPVKKEGKEEIKPKETKKVKTFKPRKIVKSNVAWRVLKGPHITEKATELIKENEYIFKVSDDSNKIEIKQAVRDVYGVDVERVNIIKVPREKRRLGKTEGWKKGYKKAIVKIKKGQEIEVLPR